MSDMDDLRKMLDAPPIGGLTMPELYSPSMTSFKMPVIPSIWETQAKLFMEGLKAQVKELEASLKPNQELAMICWHGHEKFQVLSVSMPSKNVVALNCRDAEGDVTQVTGHMNSVTFSFRIITAKEPSKRRPIGFEMPGE
jgi:hypothetical protein